MAQAKVIVRIGFNRTDIDVEGAEVELDARGEPKKFFVGNYRIERTHSESNDIDMVVVSADGKYLTSWISAGIDRLLADHEKMQIDYMEDRVAELEREWDEREEERDNEKEE